MILCSEKNRKNKMIIVKLSTRTRVPTATMLSRERREKNQQRGTAYYKTLVVASTHVHIHMHVSYTHIYTYIHTEQTVT